MRTRVLTTIAALALIAAACGGGSPEEQASSPVVVAGGEGVTAMELAYSFGANEEVSYAIDASVDMTMSMEGSEAAAGALPGDMVMGMDMSGIGTFGVADGPEPGTKEITINFDFVNMDVREFDMAGESMIGQLHPDDLLEMAGTEDLFPEMTMVVDEQGNILSVGMGGAEVPVDLFVGSSNAGGFGDLMGPTSFFGPAFPEGELSVGSTWTVSDTVEVPMIGDLSTYSDFVVVDAVEKNGHSLFLIQSTTSMDGLDVDLMQAFREMATEDTQTLAAMGMTREDVSLMTEMMAGFQMRMSMEAEPSTTMTWFDATAGLVTESDTDLDMTMVMNMVVPEEGAITMNMDMAAKVSMEYLSRGATS